MGGIYAIYFGLTLIGLLSARVYMTSRSGDAGIQYSVMIEDMPIGFDYLNLAAALLSVSVTVIWGFATLTWYWPIAIFLICGVLTGLILSTFGWDRAFRLLPIFNVVIIVGCLYLWIRYWPF